LLKESGISGGFVEKVEAAKKRGMRIIALKRPSLTSTPSPLTSYTVNGPYGLRRMVEKLLPDFFPMKTGLTTGACATAAVKAARARSLKHPIQKLLITLKLPSKKAFL
jgi:cobalt-precorrin-5B (C1)-methyltransferase